VTIYWTVCWVSDRRGADSRFRISASSQGRVQSTYEYQRTREILRSAVTPLFERRPRRWRRNLFDDLPFEKQQEAQERLAEYCKNHRGDSRRGLMPILIGQARRWTMTSPAERSRWGRRMLAKRGGYAVQQLYREQGRTGDQHPAHKAAKISVEHRRKLKKKCEEEQPPQGFPLPPNRETALSESFFNLKLPSLCPCRTVFLCLFVCYGAPTISRPSRFVFQRSRTPSWRDDSTER
jgi:hypothetical protein